MPLLDDLAAVLQGADVLLIVRSHGHRYRGVVVRTEAALPPLGSSIRRVREMPLLKF